jgi:hypothetical protein
METSIQVSSVAMTLHLPFAVHGLRRSIKKKSLTKLPMVANPLETHLDLHPDGGQYTLPQHPKRTLSF